MYEITDDLSKVGSRYIGEVFIRPRKVYQAVHRVCRRKRLKNLHLYYYGEVDEMTMRQLEIAKRW